MYGFLWLAAIVVFLVLESVTYQFICIWFAGGALGALAAYGLGATVNVQIVVFFVVSIILLVLTRPAVKKLTHKKRVKTNIDSVVGKIVVITETVDNTAGTGKAKLDGMEWTVRSFDGTVIEQGTNVTVKEVSGVKLIVE